MNSKIFKSRKFRGIFLFLFLMQFGLLVLPIGGTATPKHHENTDIQPVQLPASKDTSLQLSQSSESAPPIVLEDKKQITWTREIFAYTQGEGFWTSQGKVRRTISLKSSGTCDWSENRGCTSPTSSQKAVFDNNGEMVTKGDFLNTGKDLRVRVYFDYDSSTLEGRGKLTRNFNIVLEEWSNGQWIFRDKYSYLAYTSNAAIPVGANVDDDPNDEIVVIEPWPIPIYDRMYVYFNIFDVDSNYKIRFVKKVWTDVTLLDPTGYRSFIWAAYCFNTLSFLDESSSGAQKACRREVFKFYGQAAAEDMNGDGKDEILLQMFHGRGNWARIHQMKYFHILFTTSSPYKLDYLSMSTGGFSTFTDFDLDKKADVIFFENWLKNGIRYVKFDNGRWKHDWLIREKAPCHPPITFADANKDGKVEMYCKADWKSTRSDIVVKEFETGNEILRLNTKRLDTRELDYLDRPHRGYRPLDRILVGDFDEDEYDEVIEIRGSAIIKYDLRLSVACPYDNRQKDWTDPLKAKSCKLGKIEKEKDTVYKMFDISGFYDNYGYYCRGPDCYYEREINKVNYVVVGNFNGKTELEFMDAKEKSVDATPLIILAAPPFVEGVNDDDTTSAFGSSKSEGSGTSKTFGWDVSASITAGFQTEVNALFIKAGEFEAGVTVAGGGGRETTTTKTTTMTITQTFEAGTTDAIVYLVAQGIESRYKVVKHPDRSKIGTIVTYFKPISSELRKSELSVFKKMFPDFQIDSVITHKPGDPRTYRKVTQLPADPDPSTRKDGVYITPLKEIGQGSGTTALEISFSEEIAEDESIIGHFGGGIRGRIQSGAFFVETEISTEETWTTTGTTVKGKDAVYSATIHDIPKLDDFQNYRYKWGMVLYQENIPHKKLKNPVKVEVLDFYVDILGPFAPKTDSGTAQGVAAASGAVATGSAATGKKQKCCN
ncbi:MAG: hypothetical protein D6732_10775 [Methanobacteriota archaeon]|nr:MAG: hypothetical protein D6732_10775 [Euryarchaeota archaeon]